MPIATLSRLSVAALLLLGTGDAAQAAIGDWIGNGNARVRLLASGVDASGRLAAGIEIELDRGWKTYWRTPGDAGVPPQADFSASTNLGGNAEIAFPVPHRLDDGFATTNVYEGSVILPVAMPVVDPASPARLVVGLDIGVCDEVCIPAHFDLSLDVDPTAKDEEAGRLLAAAYAKLPGAPEPDAFAVESFIRAGGTDRKPVFSVDIVAPGADKADVFVEGPADWFPAPPKLVSGDAARATYTVEFSRTGSKVPIGGNEFRVTVVTPERSMESRLTLK